VSLCKQAQGSSDFETYARNIARHLQRNGYTLATDIHKADYAVFLTYAVGDPQTVSGVTPLWGQTGGGYSTQACLRRSERGQGLPFPHLMS
jgi:hypothetical protein